MSAIEDLEVKLATVKAHYSHSRTGKLITVKEFIRADALSHGDTFLHPDTGHVHQALSTVPIGAKQGSYVHSRDLTTGLSRLDTFKPGQGVNRALVRSGTVADQKAGLDAFLQAGAHSIKAQRHPKKHKGKKPVSAKKIGSGIADALNVLGAHGAKFVMASDGQDDPIVGLAGKLPEPQPASGWDAVLST